MVTGRALATLGLVGVALLAGCGWLRSDARRGLPGDHAAEVVYVALGDSTVEGIGASSTDAAYVGRLHARLRALAALQQRSHQDIVEGALDAYLNVFAIRCACNGSAQREA